MTVIILPEYQVLYFSVPKSGCSSIKNTLCKLYTEQELEHSALHSSERSPLIHKSNIKECYESYPNFFKFTFVRNPYSRLISFYKDKILQETQKNGSVFQPIQHYGFHSKMTFKECVELISSIPDTISDRHFRSQNVLVTLNQDLSLLNFIGRIESVNQDWEKLKSLAFSQQSQTLGILPQRNQTKSVLATAYYTDELLQLVRNRYKDDILLFQYEEPKSYD